MMSHLKFISPTIIAILLYGCYSREPIKTGLEGKPLASFNLLLTDSTYFNTSNIPKIAPAVLLYFSPRCSYCKAELKDILDHNSDLKNINFYILSTAPVKELSDFHKQNQLNKYSNIIVGYDYSNFFMKAFKPTQIPYTVIYGNDGKLREAFQGKISARLIKNTVRQ